MRAFLLLLAFLPQVADAQSDFFTVWPGHPTAPAIPVPPDTAVMREWNVGLNLRGIAANNRAVSAMRLRLPDGLRTFKMKRFSDISGFEPVGEDDFQIRPGAADREISYTWYGEAGTEQLTVAVYQGVMSATLTGGTALYSVSRRDGAPLLQQLDVRRIPPSLETSPSPGAIDSAKLGLMKLAPQSLRSLAKSSLDVVDVLVVHTPGALAHPNIGGDIANLNARIAESFLQSASALESSGMNTVRLRNVLSSGNLSVEVPYNEVPGNTCAGASTAICRWTGHRIRLRTSPSVQSLRNTYGADLG